MCSRPGFTLPPLMFSLEEVEALALGAAWVEGRADEGLKRAARGALAKIAAVLPPERAEALDWPTHARRRERAERAGGGEPAAGPGGARRRAQAQARLCRQGRPLDDPGRLAGRARFLRPCSDARRPARDARGLPAFPPRPDGKGRGCSTSARRRRVARCSSTGAAPKASTNERRAAPPRKPSPGLMHSVARVCVFACDQVISSS